MGAIEKFPEEIFHLIQSFIEAQDAAKTSLMSNLWLRAWRKQPIVQCNENYFPSREDFVNYVNRSLMRYQEKKISIDKFKLIWRRVLVPYNGYNCTLRLERWIGSAIDLGLKKLELIHVPCQFSVPPIAFEAKLLEELSVTFHPIIGKLQVPENISCFHLKKLSLSKIFFDEDKKTIENILSICRFIEFLNLHEVYEHGGKLKVQMQNLKELHVLSCMYRKFKVEAPNLEVFTCWNANESMDKSCRLYLETTENLKFLKLFRTYIHGVKFPGNNQFAKLENLIIKGCPDLIDLKVSSQKLLKNLYVAGSAGLFKCYSI